MLSMGILGLDPPGVNCASQGTPGDAQGHFGGRYGGRSQGISRWARSTSCITDAESPHPEDYQPRVSLVW